MITDRDICMTAYSRGLALSAILVSDAMSMVAYSCRATDSIEAVERLMRDKHVRRVPIVDLNNRPVGLLSLDDLARDAITRKQSEVEHAFVQTMAAVCERRLSA
jgi:CBS domain-containing protein